jgi:hypothetical protein
LSLNSSTGVISGVPTGGTATASFTIQVADNAAGVDTQPLALTVIGNSSGGKGLAAKNSSLR